MSIDGMTEPERRLRTLVSWLRNRDWAPAGADVCADDIEALLAARTHGSSPAGPEGDELPCPAFTRFFARVCPAP